jgi:hypothetical protein
VEKQRKTEEQLKADIFSFYFRYLNESSADRRQVDFAQICEAIISWCTDYLGIKANEMGIEIFNAVKRLVKENNPNVPKDETGFFKYLKTTLYTVEKEYLINDEADGIHIPKDIRRKLKIVNDIIVAKESNAGRKLTENERRQYISKWFSIAEYTELINLKKITGLNTGDDNEIDLLNSEAKSSYMESVSLNPQDKYNAKLDMQNAKDVFEKVLQDCQDRTRECYRSLFTAYCIDRSVDFGGLVPLLDNEILEAYQRDGNKPNQYEIYLKYHPEAQKTSAEAIASKMTKDFLIKLQVALKK